MITTLILLLLATAVGFAGGFYAGLKNSASSKVAKAKSIIDQIRK